MGPNGKDHQADDGKCDQFDTGTLRSNACEMRGYNNLRNSYGKHTF